MGRHSRKKQYSSRLAAIVAVGTIVLLLSFYFLLNGFNLPFFFPGITDDPEIVETITPSPTPTQSVISEEPSDLELEKEAEAKAQLEEQNIPEPGQTELAPGEVIPSPEAPGTPEEVIPAPRPQPIIPEPLQPLIPQVPLPFPMPLLPEIPAVPGIEITIEPGILPLVDIDTTDTICSLNVLSC